MPDYSLGMKIIKAGIVLVGMGRAGRVTLIVMLATANIILGFTGRGPNQAMQDKCINKSGTNETTMQVMMMSMQKNIIHKIAAGGLLRQGKSAIEHRRGWEVVGDRDPIVQRVRSCVLLVIDCIKWREKCIETGIVGSCRMLIKLVYGLFSWSVLFCVESRFLLSPKTKFY